PIPPLPMAGDYTLSNIRLVNAAGQSVLDVTPRSVNLKVIEQVLITSVQTKPLTLAEIRARGIVLDSSDYLAFEFTMAVALESKTVTWSMPVVFDRQGVLVPQPLLPPGEPPRDTVEAPAFPLPAVMPMLLSPIDEDDLKDPDERFRLPGGGGPIRIPALLVIPGNTGYLKQFFSAQLFVANGAPVGSGLVLRDVSTRIKLPAGADLQPNTADDPLALPPVAKNGQTVVQQETMTVAVAGPDGIPGTADDLFVLHPTDQGQAEYLLRGEKEGFHPLTFDISAVLDGLPVGPVPLSGRATGGVLVRNPFFNMTFTVPSATRGGEPFKLFATVTNIGQGIGNDVTVTIDSSRLSGATLVGSPTRRIDTLRTGDAQTVAFDFVAGKNGKVIASYLHFDPGAAASGDLKFALAVDERGVALSPDTLVLPTAVDKLPAGVTAAALRLLGQAWSNANAPAGTLPPGVLRIGSPAVTRKVLALAEAGLRTTLGQSVPDAVRDIAFDFYGGAPVDAGFDQLLRQTDAGLQFARAIGAALADAQALAGGIGPYERSVADIAASGPDFITFAVGLGS